MSLQDTLNNLKSSAASEIQAIEGGLEAFATKVVPVLEADVEGALATFGNILVQDVVALLNTGLSKGETVSQAAANLVKTAEGQGVTIAEATAQNAASQVVNNVETTLGALTTQPAAQ